VPTGLPGLDHILGGGFPPRSLVVLAGEPGSGKTILTLQLLFDAARRGKRCLYFTTTSEPAMRVMSHMQRFDFYNPDLLDKVTFIDLGAALREGAERAVAVISERVQQHEPDVVAVDSFKALSELTRGARPLIYDLAVEVGGWGSLTFLVGEYARDEYGSFAEFAIADGIIRLGSARNELSSIREIEVLKLRSGSPISGVHFFDISRRGITVFPRVSAPTDLQTQPSAGPEERSPTGVAGLDDLFAGGPPRASATLIQGGTGAGKTLLGLQFLLEGARRGEPGLLFTLEETPEQLRGLARSLGWDLAALEAQGLLAVRHTSPVELSTDRFLAEVTAEVAARGARRVVLDSLTTLQLGVASDRRFKEMVYVVAKVMRGAGVTLFMTAEVQQLLGAGHLTGEGASFIADNIIHLRYVEIGGRLERAISVLKARGTAHSSEVRGLSIQPGGPVVDADRFKDLRGVLTGLPAREQGGDRG
jgi:circadian clock protein KaiC